MFPSRLFWANACFLLIVTAISAAFWASHAFLGIDWNRALEDGTGWLYGAGMTAMVVSSISLLVAFYTGVLTMIGGASEMEWEDLCWAANALIGLVTIAAAIGMGLTGFACVMGATFYHLPPLIGLASVATLAIICWVSSRLERLSACVVCSFA